MKLRPTRRRGARTRRCAFALSALLALAVLVGVASAAPTTDLTDPDVRLADSFYPCPGQTDFSRPPLVEECFDASYEPLRPPIVAASTACDPEGTSTVAVAARTSGSAFIPGGGWLSGNLTWSLSATLEPQSSSQVGGYQPFPDDGARMESVGFATGPLSSLTGTFTIDPYDGGTDISGTVTLTPNGGNWGVCRTFTEEVTGSDRFGNAPITGGFYVLNGGVLSYEVTAGPPELVGETGIAEAYFMNTLATCCDAEAPTDVSSAAGHFRQQFGTIHPAEGTSGTAATPTGENVTVSDFDDVGGVSLTFSEVTQPGDTTVTLMTSAPELPSGFQVGDPPTFYEITTTAVYTPPITVCFGYGSLPAGTSPAILHYEDGAWVTVPITSDSGLPDRIACGEVDSLSPFALGYHQFTISGPFHPVDPQPTVNVIKAGRTVPVTFSLGGDFGLDVFADGYPMSERRPCDGGSPSDAVESVSSDDGLTYDAASGRYTYHWKTAGSWKGQCRTLVLRFADGQELRAEFRLT